MKALYYPYTSPQSKETLLRGLFLYEEIGTIQPKHFFITDQSRPEPFASELEKLRRECEAYSGWNPLFVLDPANLIAGKGEDIFTKSVVSDMKNPVFRANAPHGMMTLYADKITRDLFERFRGRIKSAVDVRPQTPQFDYREGPYLGAEHFIWSVDEPLAHSILLNLALIGIDKTEAVPITDSPASQRAFLCKTSTANAAENVRLAAESLLQIELPSSRGLDVRRILDFRDGHKKEMADFWRTLIEEQNRLGSEFDQGARLFANAKAEFQALKDLIASAKSDLKWDMAEIVFDLIVGFSGVNPIVTSAVAGHGTLKGLKYLSKRFKHTNGLSYLLNVEKFHRSN